MEQNAQADAMSESHLAVQRVLIGTFPAPDRAARAFSPDPGLSNLYAPESLGRRLAAGAQPHRPPGEQHPREQGDRSHHGHLQLEGHHYRSFQDVARGPRDHAREADDEPGLVLPFQPAGTEGPVLGDLVPGHGGRLRGAEKAHRRSRLVGLFLENGFERKDGVKIPASEGYDGLCYLEAVTLTLGTQNSDQ